MIRCDGVIACARTKTSIATRACTRTHRVDDAGFAKNVTRTRVLRAAGKNFGTKILDTLTKHMFGQLFSTTDHRMFGRL
jgi:hypothetical protein